MSTLGRDAFAVVAGLTISSEPAVTACHAAESIMKARTCFAAIAIFFAACANENRPQVLSGNVASTQYLAATADMRFVYARPKNPQAGTEPLTIADRAVDPGFNLCAEPSPDIAKALADAVTASAQITADGLKALGGTGANITISPGISSVQAASLTELGRRLATTQLLRDGVYRLCEAYSNGAISSREYALVLSRYGDTMVTLLAIEAVTGMAERQMAASATAAASAPAAPTPGDGGKTQDGKNAKPGVTGAGVRPPFPSLAIVRDAAMKRIVQDFIERPLPAMLKVADKPAEQHADAPGAASDGQADVVKGDRAAAARAVVELQASYLKQSAYSPLIVLCAETLANVPPKMPPKNSLESNCINVLNAFINIQSNKLAEEALKSDIAASPIPASDAAVATTQKKKRAHP
jgi:hypothetical protein